MTLVTYAVSFGGGLRVDFISMPLSLTILASAFPPERPGAIVGIWGGIAGLAVASGPSAEL